MRGAVVLLAAASLTLAACGPGVRPLELTAAGGAYNDGSGFIGLAALVTLRDSFGRGPVGAWTGVVAREGSPLADFSYADEAQGSVAAFTWPDVAVSPGSTYALQVSDDGTVGSLTAELRIGSQAPLAPAEPRVESDGRLGWDAVSGAAAYECEVATTAGVQHRSRGTEPGCDVTALPEGSYTARVLAHGADVESIRADPSQTPALPQSFSVSEARLAFTRNESGQATMSGTAVGGALHYGPSTPGLVVLLSLSAPDGAAPAESYSVEVTGPGLSSAAPLEFTYPAGVKRYLAWSYDVPARAGRYVLVATSATHTLTTMFSVGDAAATLALPAGVTASASGTGAADVSWQPVTGAASYFVGAWVQSSGTYAAGQWVSGSATSHRFETATFTAGTTYDVYVAATDVDMVLGGTPPPQAHVTENTYSPASFTAQ